MISYDSKKQDYARKKVYISFILNVLFADNIMIPGRLITIMIRLISLIYILVTSFIS